MTYQPYDGPMGAPMGDDDDETIADDLTGEDERPLDPDLDDDQINSAEADERAATEGVIDVDDLP